MLPSWASWNKSKENNTLAVMRSFSSLPRCGDGGGAHEHGLSHQASSGAWNDQCTEQIRAILKRACNEWINFWISFLEALCCLKKSREWHRCTKCVCGQKMGRLVHGPRINDVGSNGTRRRHVAHCGVAAGPPFPNTSCLTCSLHVYHQATPFMERPPVGTPVWWHFTWLCCLRIALYWQVWKAKYSVSGCSWKQIYSFWLWPETEKEIECNLLMIYHSEARPG